MANGQLITALGKNTFLCGELSKARRVIRAFRWINSVFRCVIRAFRAFRWINSVFRWVIRAFRWINSVFRWVKRRNRW